MPEINMPSIKMFFPLSSLGADGFKQEWGYTGFLVLGVFIWRLII